MREQALLAQTGETWNKKQIFSLLILYSAELKRERHGDSITLQSVLGTNLHNRAKINRAF